jgi:cytochrome b involved in lipid metabolism
MIAHINDTAESSVNGEATTLTATSIAPSPYPPKRTRNQRWLPVVLGMSILLCFACGILFFLISKQKLTSKQKLASVSGTGSQKSENSTVITVTEEELALHYNTTNDCWILIDNMVYDVTQYAPTHPGGPEYVTDFCGSNATKDFYIEHPSEYLKIYLPSDALVGVLNINGTTTTTTNITDKNVDFNASSTPTLLPPMINEPSSIPSFLPTFIPSFMPSSIPSSIPSSVPTDHNGPSSAPTEVNMPSWEPTVTNEFSLSPNFAAVAPTSKPILAASAPTKPITPSAKPISTVNVPTKPTASTSKPIVPAPTRKPITPTRKPIVPTLKPILPTKRPVAPTRKPIAPTPVPTSPPVPSCISINEVALHNSETDCYYILYDYVYDVTNYIDIHPGGSRRIFQECGTDATAVYVTEKKHDEALLLEVNAIELYGVGYAC